MAHFTKEQREKGIEKRKKRARERKQAGLPTTMNPIERLEKSRTPLNAIKAQCYDCMGRSESYREDIRICTSPKCPLFSFRPYKKKAENKTKG